MTHFEILYLSYQWPPDIVVVETDEYFYMQRETEVGPTHRISKTLDRESMAMLMKDVHRKMSE